MKPVFIVGVPRSGTSLIAGLLERMGVWAGECVGPSPENPKGFYENIRLREEINKGFLKRLGADPLGVKQLPDWEECAFLDAHSADIEAIIRDQGYTEGPWLFKDCKMVLTFPLWHRMFPEAKWIVVRRKAVDVIKSCLKTSFMKHHSNDPLYWSSWNNEYIARIADMQAVADTFEIWPQKIMEGDYGELQEMANWLGLEYSDPGDFLEESAWHGSRAGDEPAISSVLHNTRKDLIWGNIEAACRLEYPRIQPIPGHDRPIAIVAGGPSLKRTIGSLKRFQKKGGYVLAVNGVHNFLLTRGMKPDGLLLMDARVTDENLGFVSKPQHGVEYWIASQCPPQMYDLLDGYDVRIWHSQAPKIESLLAELHEDAPIILGGCTVSTRALSLALLTGYREIHVYGMDSCLSGKEHHAYRQSQNDDDKITQVRVGDRTFDLTIWMQRQAEDWQVMMSMFGDKVCLMTENPSRDFKLMLKQSGVVPIVYHGDGLLTAIIEESKRQEAA